MWLRHWWKACHNWCSYNYLVIPFLVYHPRAGRPASAHHTHTHATELHNKSRHKNAAFTYVFTLLRRRFVAYMIFTPASSETCNALIHHLVKIKTRLSDQRLVHAHAILDPVLRWCCHTRVGPSTYSLCG